MRGEVTVRGARPEDNDGLIALDAAWSMGEAGALRFDRSPDFFARAAAYEQAIVLVAEVAGRLVGVGAAAIGLWDYSRVMRFRFRGAPPGLRAERAWRESLDARGEAAPFFLTPLALRDPDRWPAVLTAVSRAVAARPREAPPALLVLPYDAQDPAFAALAAGSERDAGIHLFVRTGADPPLLDRPVFLDPADL